MLVLLEINNLVCDFYYQWTKLLSSINPMGFDSKSSW
jgi:hypothetical protein